jgi:hypothetical protein
MREHYHLTVEHIAITTVIVVIGLNVWRIVAVQLGKQHGPIGKVGRAAGALVTFSGP